MWDGKWERDGPHHLEHETMIDALIAGRMFAAATERTSASGNAYVTAKVTAASGAGESLFVNVIAFSETARTALLALDAGDSVALAGTLTPKVWTDRQGEARPALDLQAHAVLTPYAVSRKRKASQEEPAGKAPNRPAAPQSAGGKGAASFDDLGDDL